ncbi:hypothetical protein SAMN06269301_0245 [Geobacter sp. DSM 9736]|nr:hypothetical protein SAMN06269301_0245 [Geobacter sp. DSM 9736]
MVILGISLLIFLGRPWSWLGLVMLAVCAVLFPVLTIEVTEGRLIWYFGLGLIRRDVSLTEIERISVMKKDRFRVWSIDVSGRHTVEIELKDGKRIRLGTDRAEELAQVLQDATALLRST